MRTAHISVEREHLVQRTQVCYYPALFLLALLKPCTPSLTAYLETNISPPDPYSLLDLSDAYKNERLRRQVSNQALENGGNLRYKKTTYWQQFLLDHTQDHTALKSNECSSSSNTSN